jgi:adenylate cyclase
MATIDEGAQEQWRTMLSEGHPQLRWAHRVFRLLPGSPRCKVCFNPFGGLGGKVVALFGFQPSRKNPLICAL